VVEYREAAEFIVAKRPLAVIPAAAKILIADASKASLCEMADLLRKFNGEWSAEALEPYIKGYVESKGMKIGDFAKPARAALTGSNASPGLFEVIWVVGKEECIGRCEDAANGLTTVKEPAAVPSAAQPAEAESPAAPAAKATVASVVVSGDIEAQVKTIGDDIRELKAKLKAGGMSGKAIDKTEEVKALVAKLTQLKEAQAAPPAAQAASPVAASPPASGGDLEAQAKAVGDEIRELKAKLKAGGMSGKAIDKTEEVKALVAKLTELKART